MESAPDQSQQLLESQIRREGEFVSVTLHNALQQLMDRRQYKDRRRQFENGFKVIDEECIDGVFWQYTFRFESSEPDPDEYGADDGQAMPERVHRYHLVRESCEDVDVSQLADVERRAFIDAIMRDNLPDEDDDEDIDAQVYLRQIAAGDPIPCQRITRTVFTCDEAAMAIEARSDTVSYQIGNGTISDMQILVDVMHFYDQANMTGYNFLRDAGALIDNDTIGTARYSASDADLVIMRDVLQNLGLDGGQFDAAVAAPVRSDVDVLQSYEEDLRVDLGVWRDNMLDRAQPYIDRLNALDTQDSRYASMAKHLIDEAHYAINEYNQSTADELVVGDMMTIMGEQLIVEYDTVAGFGAPVMREGVIDGVFASFAVVPLSSDDCLNADGAAADSFGLGVVLEEAYITADQESQAMPVVSDLLYLPLQRSGSQMRRYIIGQIPEQGL